MTWNAIVEMAEHANKYSTRIGQLWFLLWLVFRLIVVTTIGEKVYNDERNSFVCSTKIIGCENVCYDRFAKISHIRFWSFELLAVAAPSLFFVVFALMIEGRAEKQKHNQRKIFEDIKEENDDAENVCALLSKYSEANDSSICNDLKKLQRLLRSRTKHLLNKRFDETKTHNPLMTEKRVYTKDPFKKELKIQKIYFNDQLQFFYLLSVLARTAIEITFIALTHYLIVSANYYASDTNQIKQADGSNFTIFHSLFLIEVPLLYPCTGESVRVACNQHMLPGRLSAYVPCWVSRPWEKSIFLRYMNILSFVSVLLSVAECVWTIWRDRASFCQYYKKLRGKLRKKLERHKTQERANETSPGLNESSAKKTSEDHNARVKRNKSRIENANYPYQTL